MPQHELPALYRSASLFVAPFIRDDSGNQEGLPVVLMEAIGCGCPVVVGDVAGVQDLLGDAKYELCVKPADTGALAAAIIEALEHPVQARARASMIRDRALDLIDWEFIAQRYAALIGSCVSGSAVRTKTP
jgi:glycosyltransferase involved in cell wall biosynthesis